MRTALVTGGNRGIGLAVGRASRSAGLQVVLTARQRADAAAAAAGLAAGPGPRVLTDELDLASETSVRECATRLERLGLTVDVLVNNGGVLAEGGPLALAAADFRRSLEVNLLGAVFCCQAFVPGMLARGYGRVVNVSSGWGSFAEGMEGPTAYAVSKAALNAYTLSLARTLQGDVKANACCPGWVRTRMGGSDADLAPEEAAEGILWLATMPADGPNGGFFRGREPVGW